MAGIGNLYVMPQAFWNNRDTSGPHFVVGFRAIRTYQSRPFAGLMVVGAKNGAQIAVKSDHPGL
ncbi:MAG: hypothetical protein QNJ11_18955 [Woeseiaceae bacterium]|nr:hypothetical protein [Woeseiaceae bacterium]